MFNHKEANYIDKIKKSVGEKGVDVIIEMLANVNLSNDLNLLSHGGRVIVSISFFFITLQFFRNLTLFCSNL